MKLNEIQIEVFNDNLSKAHQLIELMYRASIEPTKQHFRKQLSIRLDDIRGDCLVLTI
jgi:hypothetical protein